MLFICKNEECAQFGKEQEFSKASYKMVEGHLQATNVCPECRETMTEVPNNIPLSEKNFSIGEFEGMTKEQRQAMLKKRSHEHFEKKVKPYKEHLFDRIRKEAKGEV